MSRLLLNNTLGHDIVRHENSSQKKMNQSSCRYDIVSGRQLNNLGEQSMLNYPSPDINGNVLAASANNPLSQSPFRQKRNQANY